MKTINNPHQREGRAISVDPFSRMVMLPIRSENIFHFPEGIPAFEHVKNYVFVCKPDTQPFFFMQAIKPEDVGFVCIDPFLIYPEYCPKISAADCKFLHLENIDNALVYSIVTVTRDSRDITANLQGPIILNIKASLGKQIICDGQNYPVRFRVWDALDRMEQEQQRQRQEQNQAPPESQPSRQEINVKQQHKSGKSSKKNRKQRRK